MVSQADKYTVTCSAVVRLVQGMGQVQFGIHLMTEASCRSYATNKDDSCVVILTA